VDYGIGRSTAHRDVGEALTLVAEQAPSLHGALLAARAAGHAHVNLDGTLFRSDRVSAPGPTTRKNAKSSGPKRVKVDLWWSGKHKCHGGNVQVVTAPDGWPLWVSDVRPGREHDVTAARTDPELLAAVDAWCDEHHKVLADLGYEGERERMVVPVKAGTNGKNRAGKPIELTDDQRCRNALHSATRARAEQGNARLKQTFKILRKVRVDPWRIGALAAAALVLLHILYNRTT
ncbi:HARBI1 family protein, partial [Enterococcus hirae]|uniref:HARBI1 family protein n=1 Tax=Enterococcus hirae TaxID=1354 RepID=UPI00136C555E